MSTCEVVYFTGNFAYLGALLFEVGGPPSFLIWGWLGARYVFVDDLVDSGFEVLEGHFEFRDGV